MAETVTQLDPAMCKPKGVNVTLPPFLVEKFVTTHRLTAMWTEAFEECEYRELQTNTITIVHEHWTCVIVLDNGDQREFEAHTQEAKQYGIYWAPCGLRSFIEPMHALNFEDCTDELDRYYETLDESTMPPLPQEPWDIALRLNGGDEAKALAVLALRAHQTVHDDITMLFDDREKTHVCAQRE